jgi:capsid protein
LLNFDPIIVSANALDASTAPVTSFGYDAVSDVKKRRMSSPNLRSEDIELLQAQRQQLNAQARDSMRNFAIARWAVGKHLDFVSRHSFICQTGDPTFDRQAQSLMEWFSHEPANCDIQARHTLDRIVRMTEARAVLDGDHLLLKLDSEKIQQVESDRLRGLLGVGIDDTHVHGVELDKFGRAKRYQIWTRNLYGGYKDPEYVSADDVLFHAYYPNERSDQVRGIGLITAGLNDFVDAYEWQDLTKAAAKLRTAFGMIVTSDAVDGLGEHYETPTAPPADEQYDPYGNILAANPGRGKYEVELGKGPFKLEMDPGEDVKFLTDDSPSSETFEFFKSTIGFALKALDIPLCFYDEGLTNFFGQRAALIVYLESCKTKRRNLVTNVLRPLTKWLLVRWIASGRLKLPAGADINRIAFAWHPAGVPYWNPVQEVSADIQQIQAGLGNWEDIYLERTGRDWYADILRLKKQQDFIKTNGVLLDPKTIQFIQIASDPAAVGGSNPLSTLPTFGGLAL